MFAALLDTSVLWPSLQRDFLLSLAVQGLYRPLWSTAILDELRYHDAQKLIGRGHDPVLAAQRAQRLVDRMSTAFDDAVVSNWESLDGTFGLPDVDDEHVVAAALVGGADVIVTSNLKDFPPQQIPKPLMVISPAQFAADTVAVSPYVAYRAVMGMASRFVRPSSTVDEILDHLVARYAMIEAVELIRGVI
ncbi:PIN domain-containing protein [Mycobacterium helveticum]|jgi:predicted nucleic acid-binding protein|uniref:PIN domain-containing protein n=1 Tax=Mycobacterium helveticum TaxID=2592811 RepID=A0A557WUU9_9MYCO|nr:PIN domain-containing protein [Mycobacterium helveticum]TVS74608.1 PIN domain-containing protein [Mycobacterium helveticum]TVS77031.1 PIN domain-containing protein [Mycobacterium helveticum]